MSQVLFYHVICCWHGFIISILIISVIVKFWPAGVFWNITVDFCDFWVSTLFVSLPEFTLEFRAKLLIWDRTNQLAVYCWLLPQMHFNEFSLQSSFRFFAAVFLQKDQYILVIGHALAVKSENCILWDAPSATMRVFGALFWDWLFLGQYDVSYVLYWCCF